MKGILLLVLVAVGVVTAEYVDWSNVKPRDVKPKILDFLPTRDVSMNQERITGGSEAVPNSIPHQVALFLQGEDGTYFCGGSLISEWHVLTAAHCLDGVSNATVMCGAHNIRDPNEPRVEFQVPLSGLIIHEQYNSSRLVNDIGIIKLPEPVTFNDKIQPISLPSNRDVNSNFQDEVVVASGWGRPSDSATAISPVLRYITSNVYNLFLCQLPYLFLPTSKNICISGEKGVSTCNGDSGGPMWAFEADGTPILVGATSFGSGNGCEKNYPAVFTRITSFLPWIYEHTGIAPRP